MLIYHVHVCIYMCAYIRVCTYAYIPYRWYGIVCTVCTVCADRTVCTYSVDSTYRSYGRVCTDRTACTYVGTYVPGTYYLVPSTQYHMYQT